MQQTLARITDRKRSSILSIWISVSPPEPGGDIALMV
jgi:hypothetical protein